jgi:hypothetical protein
VKQFDMDCYEVRETDGGGMHENHVCYVSNPTLAQQLVDKSKGWRSYREYKKVLTIFDTLEEIEANSKENLRKSGIAKLSRAEREALGL